MDTVFAKLIALLLLASLSLRDACVGGCVLGDKLHVASIQLDTLTTRVVSLSSRLDTILENTNNAEYTAKSLSRSLDDDTGRRGGCITGFFPCGYGSYGAVQCVRDYLVCDGSKDCKSGADESQDICNNMPFDKLVNIPSVVIRDKTARVGAAVAMELYSNKLANFTLDPAVIIPWFPSRPQMTWRFTFAQRTFLSNEEGSLPFFGHYDYATGDVFLAYDPLHGKIGTCKSYPVSAKQTKYKCELDNSAVAIDDGKESLYLSVGILDM